MSRLGRGISGQGAFQRSALGFHEIESPAPLLVPSVQLGQQTIRVTLSRRVRDAQRRQFPLQGWGGDVVAETGSSVKRGTFERFLGPEPPGVVLPLPVLAMMTIRRVLVSGRNLPSDRLRRQTVAVLRDPAVVEPYLRAPDRRLEVNVVLQAVAERVAAQQRQPHWKLFSSPSVLALPPPRLPIVLWGVAGRTRDELVRRAAHSSLAPVPNPVRVPAVEQDEQTVRVRLADRTAAELWRRRAPHSRLASPATLAPPLPPVVTTLSVSLAVEASRLTVKRAPAYGLAGPAVVSPKPALVRVTLLQSDAVISRVDRQRRAPHSTLGLPSRFKRAPFRGVLVELAVLSNRLTTRRSPGYGLASPAVVRLKPVLVRVTLLQTDATVSRADRIRRAPHSLLGAPSHFQPAPPPLPRGPRTTLAVLSNRLSPRRGPDYGLAGPAVVASGRHPVIPVVRLGADAILSRLSLLRRPARSRLSRPACVLVPAAEQRRRTITVKLAVLSNRLSTRRAPASGLAAPAVVRPKPTLIRVTLLQTDATRTRVEAQRRAPHSKLFPPRRVRVPSVEQQENTLRVVLAVNASRLTTRRNPVSRLRRPEAVTPQPPLVRVTLMQSDATEARLALLRRPAKSKLGTPSPVRVPSVEQAAQTIRVLLASPVVANLTRRGSRYRLGAPRKINPAATFRLAALARIRPRPVHSHLFPPVSLRPVPAIRVTLAVLSGLRSGTVRRSPHAILRRPVILPARSTIRVTLAGRTRLDERRRAPRSKLSRPVVVLVPAVEQAEDTIRVRLAWPLLPARVYRPVASRIERPATLRLPAPVTVRLAVLARIRLVNRGGLTRRISAKAAPASGVVAIVLVRWTRLDERRRAPHSRLFSPARVRVPAVELRERTIVVKFADRTPRDDLGRRSPRSKLSRPLFLPARSVVRVTLAGRTRVELVRRSPHYKLGRPTVVVVPAVEQREEAIVVRLAPAPRAARDLHSRLFPPTTLRVFGGPTVRTVRTRGDEARRRRPLSTRLVPPAWLQPVKVAPTVVTVALTAPLALLRRPVRSRLRRPAWLLPEGDWTGTLVVASDRLDRVRRPARSRLSLPQVILPLPSAEVLVIRVVLAGRTRAEAVRRAPRSALYPPGTARIAKWCAGPLVRRWRAGALAPGRYVALPLRDRLTAGALVRSWAARDLRPALDSGALVESPVARDPVPKVKAGELVRSWRAGDLRPRLAAGDLARNWHTGPLSFSFGSDDLDNC